MKAFYTLIIIGIFTLAAAAQSSGIISGRVTQNGKPIAGASVGATVHDAAGNKTISAATDADGFYRIGNLRPGSYMVVAEGERGKGIAYVDNVTVTNSGEVSLDLMLSLETYDVFSSQHRFSETVSVSVNSTQPIDEVSKSVDIISGQEMRDRADFAVLDALRTIPGFRVQQLGGFGRTASIKTRGLRNQDTAILLDGIRFRDVASITGDASAFLSDLTLTSVSRIEVLRGSGSSIHGTNAIGGAINFTTPDPQAGMHGQFSGAWGGLGLQRYRGNISDGTEDGKLGFNAAISRTVYTKGIDGDDDAHNTNVQSRLKWQPSANSNLSARLFISDAYVKLNVSPDSLSDLPASNLGIIDARPGVNFLPDQNDPDSDQSSKFFNGQIVLSQIVKPDLLFQSYYSGIKTSRKSRNGALGPGFQGESTSLFDGTVQTLNGTFDWSPSDHSIKAGYEFEHEKFGNDGLTPDGSGNFYTRAYQASHTIYAQDVIGLMDRRLQIAIGARAQWFDLDDPKFSLQNSLFASSVLRDPAAAYTFDGAVSYFFARTGTKLRAHVGNGYRVPSLYERFGTFFSSFGTPEFIAIGDPALKAERSAAFDAGVEQDLFGGKSRLTAVYFYTHLIDTIGYGNVVPNVGSTQRPFGGYENQNGGISRGTELSATIRPFESTYIFASYTYTNSDQATPQVSGSGVYRTLGVPVNQFTLVATQRIGRFWASFDFLGTSSYLAPIFSGTRFNSYVYRFAGNKRADLTAGYSLPLRSDKLNLRIFGTAENLFDHEYFENGFRTAGASGRFGLAISF